VNENLVWDYCWDDSDRGKQNVQNNPISVSNFPTEFLQDISLNMSRAFVVRDL